MMTDSLTKRSQGLITIQLLSMKLFCLSRPKLGIFSLFSIVPVFHFTVFLMKNCANPPVGGFGLNLIL